MFYEEAKINEALSCAHCKERLIEPKILPCGVFICVSCATSIKAFQHGKFKCIICTKKHAMPEEGLPTNSQLLYILTLKPTEVSRGKDVKILKETLNQIQKNIKSISFGANNGLDQIKEHCIELKNDVQLASEEAIQQINDYNDEFIKEIENYEMECIQSFKSVEVNKEEFNKTVDQLEPFYSKWSEYLKQTHINDDHISDAISEASRLNENAEQKQLTLENYMFNGHILKFVKNPIKLDKSFVGYFQIEDRKDMNSTILTQSQMLQLWQMCSLPFHNWELIYRATQDGFDAAQFHSKCDHKSTTFIVIKSTSGYVFGGYTQQDWSGNYINKMDANAFLFSFINKENKPCVIKCHQPANAICCYAAFGPRFGEGADLYICNNSNVSNESYSNLGGSYSHPDFTYGMNEAQSFLAGSYNFQTTEIEVYSK